MRNTISKKRERLFDKLREIYYDIDWIHHSYRNEHQYNEKIRKEAERRQTYVGAFRDVEGYLTIEGLQYAVSQGQRRLDGLREIVKKEEA